MRAVRGTCAAHGVKAHRVGQDALFEYLLKHSMVVEVWPLHFLRQAVSHAIPHSKRGRRHAAHMGKKRGKRVLNDECFVAKN